MTVVTEVARACCACMPVGQSCFMRYSVPESVRLMAGFSKPLAVSAMGPVREAK